MKHILVLTIGLFLFGGAQAQLKVGYVDIQMILLQMPERDSIESVLKIKQQELREKIEAKQQLMQQKYATFQKRAQLGEVTPKEQQEMEQEIQKMQQDLQAMAQTSEQELLEKEQELLSPIETRIVKIIDDLREEKKYDIILNAVDGTTGSRIVISSDKEADLTDDVLKKMGITETVKN